MPLHHIAGGGYSPELGLFLGQGSFLAEELPDGSWQLASFSEEPSVAFDVHVAFEEHPVPEPTPSEEPPADVPAEEPAPSELPPQDTPINETAPEEPPISSSEQTEVTTNA